MSAHTQPSEAHRKLAAEIIFEAESITPKGMIPIAAQLISDSEARAVERWSGGFDMSLPDLYEAAKSERDKAIAALTSEREKVRVLREALEGIIKSQPCTVNGDCFYPMHDGDGEYIGEQNVDPLSVIGGMVQLAQAALAATEGKTP